MEAAYKRSEFLDVSGLGLMAGRAASLHSIVTVGIVSSLSFHRFANIAMFAYIRILFFLNLYTLAHRNMFLQVHSKSQ